MKTFTATFLNGLVRQICRYEVRDAATDNLSIAVNPTGTKVFIWRGILNGKNTKLTLGRYPRHSLSEARLWAANITRGKENGIDFLAEEAKALAEQEKLAIRTCDWLFNLYMQEEGNGRASANEKWRLYRREIQPVIGSRPAASITHNDLASVVRSRRHDAPTTSNALQRLIRRWFRWSVTYGRDLTGLTEDPARDLPKFAPDQARKRFLCDFEISALLSVLEASSSRFVEPLLLTLYTGARRAEVFELPWRELDLDRGDWLIPGRRTKNGMDHLLPLPVEMVAMLRRIKRLPDMPLVWPSKSLSPTPMSGFSKALATLNQTMATIAAKAGREMEPWSIHDLRRTVVTGMNGLRAPDHSSLIPEHIVERVVNHKPPRMSGTYNRHGYYAEKKRALRHWADHLESLRERGWRPD